MTEHQSVPLPFRSLFVVDESGELPKILRVPGGATSSSVTFVPSLVQDARVLYNDPNPDTKHMSKMEKVRLQNAMRARKLRQKNKNKKGRCVHGWEMCSDE